VGSSSNYYYVDTINNNIDTTYVDNISDDSLTDISSTMRDNTSFGKIIVDGTIAANLGFYNVFIGRLSGESIIDGFANVGVGTNTLRKLTSGYENIAIGYNALSSNVGGDDNIAIGYNALSSNVGGYKNIAIGLEALTSNETGNCNNALGTSAGSACLGSNNIFIGESAGRYETDSNSFYVNNQNRTDITGDKTKSILYGVMASNPSNQTLTTNANFIVTQALQVGATSNTTPGTILVSGNYIGAVRVSAGTYTAPASLSANNPAYSFAGDTNTGINQGGTPDNVNIVTGGTNRLTADAAGNITIVNNLIKSIQASITAYATGGQANAVAIIKDIAEISVCATNGDSVKLPVAIAGLQITIINHGAASCDVFPNTDDSINEEAANTAKALAADTSMMCTAYDTTNWECITLSR